MKAFTQVRRSLRNKSTDESKKLINLEVNQQNYGDGKRSKNSSISSPPPNRRTFSDESASSILSTSSPQPNRRTVRDGGATYETPTVVIRPGSHSSQINPSKIEAIMDLQFDKVPFQFYSRESVCWKAGFLQAFILLLICMLVPSIFILFYVCGKKTRMSCKPFLTQEERHMTVKERRNSVLYILPLLLISITKDLIITMIVLHVLYGRPATPYEIAYSPFIFFWSLILFGFPLMVFYFAKVQYRFGFDSDKKKLFNVFSTLLSSKAKEFEFKKTDDQEKYFNERYKDLSSIKGCKDEFKFLMRCTSKPLLASSIFISVMMCTTHCLIPLFLDIINCPNQVQYHFQGNDTHNVSSNSTLPTGVYKSVIGLSAVNTLLVSLFASSYFIYLSLWKIAMLSEWKRFNATESESTTTLVNGGPQGIAMWWKIRQTLKLFSTSNLCMTVFVGKMACVATLAIITGLSMTLIYYTVDRNSSFRAHSAIPLLFDNVLLYIVLVVIGWLSLMIGREQTQSGCIIELKKLNVSYEVGRLMNMDQESVENEPSVRIKLRVMRGCLMLLQELTSTMENLERSTSSQLIVICLCVATIAVVPSASFTVRFLLSKKYF